jgi:hypothetical protein
LGESPSWLCSTNYGNAESDLQIKSGGSFVSPAVSWPGLPVPFEIAVNKNKETLSRKKNFCAVPIFRLSADAF